MISWKKCPKRRVLLYLSAAISVLLGIVLMRVYSAVRFTGALLCLLGGVLVLWAVLDKGSEKSHVARIARRLLALLLCSGVLLFALLEAQVLRCARTESEAPVAGVIILGAGVNGTAPSLSLRVRLEAALEYLDRCSEDIPILVTGSQGPGELISEARCMADWLIAHGVAEHRILLEEQADNTEENIAYSKAMLRENGYDLTASYALVSSDYHLCRVQVLWGERTMVGVAARMPERYAFLTANYYIREAFALAAKLPEVLRYYC